MNEELTVETNPRPFLPEYVERLDVYRNDKPHEAGAEGSVGCDCANLGCGQEYGPQHVEMDWDELYFFRYGLKPGEEA